MRHEEKYLEFVFENQTKESEPLVSEF